MKKTTRKRERILERKKMRFRIHNVYRPPVELGPTLCTLCVIVENQKKMSFMNSSLFLTTLLVSHVRSSLNLSCVCRLSPFSQVLGDHTNDVTLELNGHGLLATKLLWKNADLHRHCFDLHLEICDRDDEQS